jgi:PST family polysaccharide transporter
MPDMPSRPELMRLVRNLVGHPVARNTLALYGIQFTGYVIPLLTLPYLARVLGAAEFGLLLFAQSFALWVSITLEYGFNLSATRDVARNQGKRQAVAATAAEVLGAKLLLLSGFAVIIGFAGFTVGNFRQHPDYFLCTIVNALAMGFSPFWYFQGTERMVGAILVEFFARIAAAVSIFLVVRTSQDGWKALASLAVAACAILLIQTFWMYREIGFRRPRWQDSARALTRGWDLFLFRGAFNIYTSANAFILGLFVPALQVGYFGGAERIARAVQGLTGPFTQALYPYLSRLASDKTSKATRLVRYTLPLAGAAGLALAVALALLASRLVLLILGRDYQDSVRVLYVFALILPLNTINSALIMQWMLPRGMERIVGAVTAGAIVINVISASLLAPLFACLGMAWAILIAESCQFTALVTVSLRRDLFLRRGFQESKSQVIELL